MRTLCFTAVALVIAIFPLRPLDAAHFCTAETGSFVALPLPPNPVYPERTHLYLHDRADVAGMGFAEDGEGTWIYLENGKVPNEYNSGGLAIVGPFNSLGSADTPCGAHPCPDCLSVSPRTGADDVIF